MRVLHVFGPAPDPLSVDRAARVAQGLGSALTHLLDDAAHLPAFDGTQPRALPAPLPLTGRPSLARYTAIARAIPNCELVLTYGPAAIDILAAKRIFARSLPPVVHHEGEGGMIPWLARRLLLPAAAAVALPGAVPDGVDETAFAPGQPGAALPGLARRRGDFVVGAFSPLRAGLGLTSLIRAVAVIPNAKLVVIGVGPDANRLAAEARRADLGARLVLPREIRDRARALRQLDLLAIPAGGLDRFSLLEAMATGLPIVAPASAAALLPEESRPATWTTAAALRDTLLRLAGNSDLRARLGAANRARILERHRLAPMLDAHRQLYAQASGVFIA